MSFKYTEHTYFFLPSRNSLVSLRYPAFSSSRGEKALSGKYTVKSVLILFLHKEMTTNIRYLIPSITSPI